MAERLTLSLYNAQQAHQAIQTAWMHAKGWLMASDTRLTLEIRPEKRSDAQNRRLWAMLADISAQVDWYPMRFAIAEGWAKFNAKKPAPAKQRPVYARPANPLFTAWSHAA